MYYIVGLGNPGIQYENTRHNAGFITIDYLARKYSIDVRKIKFNRTVSGKVRLSFFTYHVSSVSMQCSGHLM